MSSSSSRVLSAMRTVRRLFPRTVGEEEEVSEFVRTVSENKDSRSKGAANRIFLPGIALTALSLFPFTFACSPGVLLSTIRWTNATMERWLALASAGLEIFDTSVRGGISGRRAVAQKVAGHAVLASTWLAISYTVDVEHKEWICFLASYFSMIFVYDFCFDYANMSMMSRVAVSLAEGVMLAVVFAIIIGCVGGYVYAALHANDATLELIVTGFAYPVVSKILRVILIEVVIKREDEHNNVDSVEDGYLLPTFMVLELVFELPNAFSIFMLPKLTTSLLSILASFSAKIALKISILEVHRRQVISRVKRAFCAPAKVHRAPNSETPPRRLSKASERHCGPTDLHKEHALHFYTDLGERIAFAIAAIIAVVLNMETRRRETGDLGLRIIAATAAQYLAACFLWFLYEYHGYYLYEVQASCSAQMLLCVAGVALSGAALCQGALMFDANGPMDNYNNNTSNNNSF